MTANGTTHTIEEATVYVCDAVCHRVHNHWLPSHPVFPCRLLISGCRTHSCRLPFFWLTSQKPQTFHAADLLKLSFHHDFSQNFRVPDSPCNRRHECVLSNCFTPSFFCTGTPVRLSTTCEQSSAFLKLCLYLFPIAWCPVSRLSATLLPPHICRVALALLIELVLSDGPTFRGCFFPCLR